MRRTRTRKSRCHGDADDYDDDGDDERFLFNSQISPKRQMFSGSSISLKNRYGDNSVHGTPWPAMAFRGWPWQVMVCHGKPWSAMATHGVPWSAMGSYGGQRHAIMAGQGQPLCVITFNSHNLHNSMPNPIFQLSPSLFRSFILFDQIFPPFVLICIMGSENNGF